jgi:hypothetical protein
MGGIENPSLVNKTIFCHFKLVGGDLEMRWDASRILTYKSHVLGDELHEL